MASGALVAMRATPLQPLRAAASHRSIGRSREIADGSEAHRSRPRRHRRAVDGGRQQLRAGSWLRLQPARRRRPRGCAGRQPAPLQQPQSSPTASSTSSRLLRTQQSALLASLQRTLRVRGGRPRSAGSWHELTCGTSARESAVRRAVAALVQLGHSTPDDSIASILTICRTPHAAASERRGATRRRR